MSHNQKKRKNEIMLKRNNKEDLDAEDKTSTESWNQVPQPSLGNKRIQIEEFLYQLRKKEIQKKKKIKILKSLRARQGLSGTSFPVDQSRIQNNICNQQKINTQKKYESHQQNYKEPQKFSPSSFLPPPKNGIETEKICKRIRDIDLYQLYKKQEKTHIKTMMYGMQWITKRQIYTRDFIEDKIRRGDFERRYKDGNTVLHICIIQGINDLAKKIIAEAINTQQQNEEGLTPLHIACIQKNYDIFKYIIDNKLYNLNIKDKRKRTCLHISSYLKEYKFCKKLLKKKADANIQSTKSYSPLVISMINSDFKLTKMLIQNGALIDQQEQINGQTPLITMFMQKNEKGLNYLLKCGANKDAQNQNMENVINVALRFTCDISKNIEVEKQEKKIYCKCLQILLKEENNKKNCMNIGSETQLNLHF